MKTSNVFSTFHSHKIPPLAFLGLLQTDDRFPYSFYTSLCFEQLSTSFPGVLGYLIHFATNNHQPFFQGSQREPWERGCRTVWMVDLWFNYVIFRVLSFTFRKDSSRANQLPCQSCCVEVSSILSVTSVYDHEQESDKLGCFLTSTFNSFSYQRLVSAPRKKIE